MKLPMIAAALTCGTSTLAAPPSDASTGMASGKMSMSDLHFSTHADAAAHCDNAAISTGSDGGYICAAPAGTAINEKGPSGTKSAKPATPK